MSISPPSSRRFPGPQKPPHTLRSITGTELFPTSSSPSPGSSNPNNLNLHALNLNNLASNISNATASTVNNSNNNNNNNSPTDKRYYRHNIALFRAATGEECALPPLVPVNVHGLNNINGTNTVHTTTSSDFEEDLLLLDTDQSSCKPRISSVTDVSHPSPDNSHIQIDPLDLHRPLPDIRTTPIAHLPDDDDDGASTYSHASAINLDDIDDDELSGVRLQPHPSAPPAKAADGREGRGGGSSKKGLVGRESKDSEGSHSRLLLNRQILLENRRKSFANSFAKAQQARASAASTKHVTIEATEGIVTTTTTAAAATRSNTAAATAEQSRATKRAVVVARPELQPHNRSLTLMERCVRALTEVLDMNQLYAKSATERFVAFSALYTADERQVIAELLRQAGMRLRSEAPTPWRTPITTHKRSVLRPAAILNAHYDSSSSSTAMIKMKAGTRAAGTATSGLTATTSSGEGGGGGGGGGGASGGFGSIVTSAIAAGNHSHGGNASGGISSANQLSNVFRSPWTRVAPKVVTSDTLVRSVVFGSHVIPGVQSAESILLRMAGEFQRDEVTRKATRSERVDIPLSFAMTLTAVLATFARLECTTTYRRYRSRSASKRRSSPHALIWLKTRYDGLRLSFAVTLHGESPCTVLFRRPRIFSLRKIEDYASLVTEAKDIMAEFGREVVGRRD